MNSLQHEEGPGSKRKVLAAFVGGNSLCFVESHDQDVNIRVAQLDSGCSSFRCSDNDIRLDLQEGLENFRVLSGGYIGDHWNGTFRPCILHLDGRSLRFGWLDLPAHQYLHETTITPSQAFFESLVSMDTMECSILDGPSLVICAPTEGVLFAGRNQNSAEFHWQAAEVCLCRQGGHKLKTKLLLTGSFSGDNFSGALQALLAVDAALDQEPQAADSAPEWWSRSDCQPHSSFALVQLDASRGSDGAPSWDLGECQRQAAAWVPHSAAASAVCACFAPTHSVISIDCLTSGGQAPLPELVFGSRHGRLQRYSHGELQAESTNLACTPARLQPVPGGASAWGLVVVDFMGINRDTPMPSTSVSDWQDGDTGRRTGSVPKEEAGAGHEGGDSRDEGTSGHAYQGGGGEFMLHPGATQLVVSVADVGCNTQAAQDRLTLVHVDGEPGAALLLDLGSLGGGEADLEEQQHPSLLGAAAREQSLLSVAASLETRLEAGCEALEVQRRHLEQKQRLLQHSRRVMHSMCSTRGAGLQGSRGDLLHVEKLQGRHEGSSWVLTVEITFSARDGVASLWSPSLLGTAGEQPICTTGLVENSHGGAKGALQSRIEPGRHVLTAVISMQDLLPVSGFADEGGVSVDVIFGACLTAEMNAPEGGDANSGCDQWYPRSASRVRLGGVISAQSQVAARIAVPGNWAERRSEAGGTTQMPAGTRDDPLMPNPTRARCRPSVPTTTQGAPTSPSAAPLAAEPPGGSGNCEAGPRHFQGPWRGVRCTLTQASGWAHLDLSSRTAEALRLLACAVHEVVSSGGEVVLEGCHLNEDAQRVTQAAARALGREIAAASEWLEAHLRAQQLVIQSKAAPPPADPMSEVVTEGAHRITAPSDGPLQMAEEAQLAQVACQQVDILAARLAQLEVQTDELCSIAIENASQLPTKP
ncbi:hypothetical protein CYMTET_13175 [Cymbomonas tetramitiformis]|uniref:Uncharacterized protein n=1 Tax=Cymbomonas tetramitiformis TaxID=36881 RepID=A0AAE0GIN6_9CHLO|nr:hypothetical protein CYMTET_13175 [Cymbomonas tetramitiformis]